MDPKIYAKMQKVRKAENLNLKASRFLRSTIEHKGKTLPFNLRNYQTQMVFHTLLSKRFIIGDDTGLGKCCRENSLISTTNGLVPIGDMHDWSGMEPETFEPIDREWNVLVDGEELPVKNFYYGGVKPTVKMRTAHGFEVEGSRVHPLLVWRDSDHQWVEMQDLQEGDHICVERREMCFPEGSVSSADITKATSSDTIPTAILRSNRESNIKFLRALFERDSRGSCGERVTFSTSSEEMGRQVQIMLARFGVISKRVQDGGAWTLTVSAPYLSVLHDKLGIFSESNSTVRTPTHEPSGRYFYDPVVTLEEGEEEVFDIEVDDPRHCFVSNGILNHNTLEAITTLGALWEKDPDLKVIIVTNTSVMNQWGAEIDKFTEGIRWRVCKGGPEKRTALYEDYFTNWDEDEPEVLIINYHRMRRDKRAFQAFSEGHRYCLILDEVTAVKNPESKTHHVFRELSLKADRVYGLTATLIKNNLEEGFGIYRVVVPDLFRTKQGFYRNFCQTRMQRIPGTRKKVPVIVGHTRKQIADFRTTIDPYYLGRAKHDVADELPVLTTKDISMPMERSQYIYYQEALEGLLTLNADSEDEEEREVTKLTQLIYCQEIVDSPALIGNDVKSGKEEYFLELLKEELEGEKVIVFTRFKSMVNRLQNILEKDGYALGIHDVGKKDWQPVEDTKAVPKGLVRITGDETPEQRDAGRRAFTDTKNTNLIFLTMAGAEAINLQEARVMIFYDLPWSAGDYIQLVGRMIRIGSPHDRVYALHLLSETPEGYKTIDHHVRETLEKKMGYIEQALGERLVKDGEEIIRTAAGDDDAEIIKVETSSTSDLFDLLLNDAKTGEKKND